MRVVIAEDLALLRDGLTPAARGQRLRGRRRGRGRRRRSSRRSSASGPTSASSTCACRRRSATRASAARSRRASALDGLPVLVLSQYVERVFAKELLADGRGGVGYLLKDRVADPAEFVEAVRRVAARRDGDGSRRSSPSSSPAAARRAWRS